MRNVIIAIIGEDNDASEILFKGFKTFQPQIVHLLIKKGYEKKAKKVIKDLEKFGVEVFKDSCSEMLYIEEVFLNIKKLSEIYKQESVVINVDTDYMSSCLALSSAFVNGIQAVGMLGDELITYPIMKFSYYNAINEKKMQILKTISKKNNGIESMEKLSKLTKMSLPLIAYHLRGNRDSQGLIDMNLIDTQKKAGSLCVKLTDLGKLIVNGSVKTHCNKKQ